VAVQELNLVADRELKHRGHLARAFSRLIRKKLALVSIVTIVLLYSGGTFANWVTPYRYTDQDYTAIRQPPSLQHWAGTDFAGRDVFTRVLWGIQNTVILTTIGMLTGALLVGVTMGLVAGYFGKKIDAVIMRTGEVFSAFPDILLVIILAATLAPRVREWVRWLEDNTFLDGLVQAGLSDYVVISLALISFVWFGMARLVRGQILFLKETQHVEAAKATGASTPRILFKHLLPNAISPIIVTVSMGMGSMVGTEIILSWLGIGIQPPRPSLGLILFEASNIGVLRNDAWLLLAPGAAVFLMVLAWNLLGDALNDALNPRTR
jgi:ABC-type dipeptide/oligopeptide/nickel transport system permease subunit